MDNQYFAGLIRQILLGESWGRRKHLAHGSTHGFRGFIVGQGEEVWKIALSEMQGVRDGNCN